MIPYFFSDQKGDRRIVFRPDGADGVILPSERCYWISGGVVRFINWRCLETRQLHADHLPTRGPAIVAVTHLSHLEPVMVSIHCRPMAVHWMTRLEFYRNPLARFLLKHHLTFPVDRGGMCLGTLRYALKLLGAGKAVGIFPEGGVAHGPGAAIRGGPIKLGTCFLSCRSGVPVTPVVIIGTHTLNRVRPWLPLNHRNVWMATGEPIYPPERRDGNRREQRIEMGRRLTRAYQSLYEELLQHTDLPAEHAP